MSPLRVSVRLGLLRGAGALVAAALNLWFFLRPASAADRRRLRILVVRPDHLGDVLLTTPALSILRRALPHAEISCLVGPWAGPVLRGNPDVDIVLGCPFPGFERRPGQPSPSLLMPYLLLVRYALLLRRQGPYDAAVLLRDDHWWGALLAYLAGIPLRLGVRRADAAPFLTVALDPNDSDGGGAHRVEQNAALAVRLVECLVPASAASPPGQVDHATPAPARMSTLPPLVASVGAGDVQAAQHLLAAHGLDRAPRLLALQAGAGAPLKLWSPEACAVVVATLARDPANAVILVGSAAERPLAHQIAALARAAAPHSTVAVLAGETSWGVLAAVLDRCALVIGVDSGTLHLAVARGRPSVALFGPVDPRLFGPWARGTAHERLHRVVTAALPCQPCGRLDYCALQPQGGVLPVPCLASISPATVLDTARDLLGPAMMEG